MYIWADVRVSDKVGVEGCCEDREKVDAVLQRLSWVRSSGGVYPGGKEQGN